MTRKAKDWGGNIGAFLLMVLVNILSGVVPLGGQTMTEISAKYPSLFTPAGFTFSIWGLIYLALSVFVIYQALPKQRMNAGVARIGFCFKVSCLANSLWIFAWHYDMLLLSLLLMICILLSLVVIYRRLHIVDKSECNAQRWMVQIPFSLYTGWISVATIANISAVQTGMGWDTIGMSAISWTLIKLALAGAVAATVILRRGDVVFVLVVAWAAFGISVMQAVTPAVAGAAGMLAILALLLVAGELFHRFRPRRVAGIG